MHNIAIIIPCYNEEQRLHEKNIDYLVNHTDADVYFANDGSTDGTVSVLNHIVAKYPERCFVLDYKQNSGKANTIYKSINEILDKGTYTHIGYFDADFSTPPEEIKRLLEEINTSGVAFLLASRVKLLNSGIKRKTSRHYIGRTIITLINLKFDLGIYDTQCGAKVFSKDIIPYGFDKPFKTSWLFDIEVFIRLRSHGLLTQGKEMPVTNWVDVDGSKLSWKSGFKIFKELLLLRNNY
nr:glycosyltransferase [uncultured Flavobacterium sp.]